MDRRPALSSVMLWSPLSGGGGLQIVALLKIGGASILHIALVDCQPSRKILPSTLLHLPLTSAG